MPFFLIFVGLMLLIVAVRGTQQEFIDTLKDMFIQPQFWSWGVVILFAGLLGYNKQLRSLSVSFMSLILIAMILSNKSVVSEFFKQLQEPTRGNDGIKINAPAMDLGK